MRRPVTSGAHRVVAQIEFGDAFPGRHSWLERDQQPVVDFMGFIVQRVLDDDGDILEAGADAVTVSFGEDQLAAASSMIAIQEAFVAASDPAVPLPRVGVAMSRLIVHDLGGVEQRLVLGPAMVRAKVLATHAAPGAVLLDNSVVEGLVMQYISSSAGAAARRRGNDYLSPVRELRDAELGPPLAFHELRWSSGDFGTTTAKREDSRLPGVGRLLRGSVGQLSPDGSRWTVEDGSHVHVVERSAVVGDAPVTDSSVVYFRPDVSSIYAHDVVVLGSRLVATVRKVFPDRNYAFLDVAGHDVFLHGSHNQWPVNVGDVVSFVADENERGLIARDAEIVG